MSRYITITVLCYFVKYGDADVTVVALILMRSFTRNNFACDNWGKSSWLLLSGKDSLYYGTGVMQRSGGRARFLSPRRLEGGKEVFVRLNEIVGGRDGGGEGGGGLPDPNITARRMRAIK